MSKDVFTVTVSCCESEKYEFLEALRWSLSKLTCNTKVGEMRCFMGTYVVDKDVMASSEDIKIVIREQLSEFMDKNSSIRIMKTLEWS